MDDPLIDDAARGPRTGTDWELVSDRVMGGVSDGTLADAEVAGRAARRMQGEVSLENDGGFLQMALDLTTDGRGIDARRWQGLELTVLGNVESYNVHLRTEDMRHSWQSYRATFDAPDDWTTHCLPFARFEAHRIDAPLDLSSLRRIGLVAIGRAFHADLALARLAFY